MLTRSGSSPPLSQPRLLGEESKGGYFKNPDKRSETAAVLEKKCSNPSDVQI